MSDEKAIYNGYEEEWEKVYGKTRDPVRNLLIYPEIDRLITNFVPENIIDAGCGNGGLLQRYRRLNFQKAIGVDLSSKFIEIASNDNDDSRIEYITGDLSGTIAIEDSWGDLIFSVFVLNEVKDLKNGCRELARMLRADGKLIIVLTHPFQILYEILGQNKSPKFSGDINYFEENEIIYHFSLSNAKARYYHHNFEHISECLYNSNLQVCKLKEVTTNHPEFKNYSDYWKQKSIPLYLVLEVKKI